MVTNVSFIITNHSISWQPQYQIFDDSSVQLDLANNMQTIVMPLIRSAAI